MTTITAMMINITITMVVIMVPGIFYKSIKADELWRMKERELLRELLVERNGWVLRHLGCGLGALLLIWMAKTSPGMEVPNSLTSAAAIYATISLLFSILKSMLAQRIAGLLAAVPVRVKVRDRG